MTTPNHQRWTAKEKALVFKKTGVLTATKIAKALKAKGFPRRTAAAVRGIIRRHKTNCDGDLGKSRSIVNSVAKTRIMYFDIEASDLSAGFGEMLSFGYWWHDEPEPKVLNMYDYKGWNKLPVEQRDYYLVKDVMKLIESANVIIGHYSTKFDTPFIQTRCLFHNFGPIPLPLQIDTWRIARYQLKLNNNRLKTVAKAFNCGEQKDEVPMNIWRRAKAHDLEALKIISAYNLQDVRTQRSITEKLMPLARGIPNWNLLTDDVVAACPSCGGTKLVHRGFKYTKLYKYNRLRCSDCGKWMRERNSVVAKDVKRHID